MSGPKLTVVISQGQSKNPAQRRLEESLARELMETGVAVSVVPHLYDMSSDHDGMQFLRSIPGDIVFFAWLYPRAVRWTLHRQGVSGQEGISLLVEEDEEENDDAEERPSNLNPAQLPDRFIYCIDLRLHADTAPYIEEVQRIAESNPHQVAELASWIQGQPQLTQLKRYLASATGEAVAEIPSPQDDAPPRRRWYPVIDYSRCTNCMECIDFCLFGVYGLDTQETILVEAQDNCKKGCPACSRVCPENAIMFPQHKTPAIAGAEGEVAGLKIDLSVLFGGGGRNPLELAVAERDNELVRDGRDAVGMTVGIPKRQNKKAVRPKDELDLLMDEFDALRF